MDLNFGHMIIEKDGIKCTCGKSGCLERYASMNALKQKVANRKKLEHVSGKELYEMIKSDEEDIRDIIKEFIQNLSIGLTNIIRIFEPEIISIGGSFIYFEDLLLDKLNKSILETIKLYNEKFPKIVVASLGNDAGIIGATIV